MDEIIQKECDAGFIVTNVCLCLGYCVIEIRADNVHLLSVCAVFLLLNVIKSSFVDCRREAQCLWGFVCVSAHLNVCECLTGAHTGDGWLQEPMAGFHTVCDMSENQNQSWHKMWCAQFSTYTYCLCCIDVHMQTHAIRLYLATGNIRVCSHSCSLLTSFFLCCTHSHTPNRYLRAWGHFLCGLSGSARQL